jgi:predicted outer membrane lipoprotein
VQTLSPQDWILGLVGAIEAGIALWYFTNGHWVNGTFLTIAVAFLIAVYFHRERKVKGRRGRETLLRTRSARVSQCAVAAPKCQRPFG